MEDQEKKKEPRKFFPLEFHSAISRMFVFLCVLHTTKDSWWFFRRLLKSQSQKRTKSIKEPNDTSTWREPGSTTSHQNPTHPSTRPRVHPAKTRSRMWEIPGANILCSSTAKPGHQCPSAKPPDLSRHLVRWGRYKVPPVRSWQDTPPLIRMCQGDCSRHDRRTPERVRTWTEDISRTPPQPEHTSGKTDTCTCGHWGGSTWQARTPTPQWDTWPVW